MYNNIAVIYNILGLLPTIQEGLNHIQKQLSELRYEQALDLLEDTMMGIASIESALQPIIIESGENTKEMKFEALKKSMSKVVSLYETGKETELERQIQETILPEFKAWKEELDRVLKPLVLS